MISAEEGVRALYNGLIAGLHRQMCFASVRIGCYDSVKNMYITFFHGKRLRIYRLHYCKKLLIETVKLIFIMLKDVS